MPDRPIETHHYTFTVHADTADEVLAEAHKRAREYWAGRDYNMKTSAAPYDTYSVMGIAAIAGVVVEVDTWWRPT